MLSLKNSTTPRLQLHWRVPGGFRSHCVYLNFGQLMFFTITVMCLNVHISNWDFREVQINLSASAKECENNLKCFTGLWNVLTISVVIWTLIIVWGHQIFQNLHRNYRKFNDWAKFRKMHQNIRARSSTWHPEFVLDFWCLIYCLWSHQAQWYATTEMWE